jgi:hypothetical protein
MIEFTQIQESMAVPSKACGACDWWRSGFSTAKQLTARETVGLLAIIGRQCAASVPNEKGLTSEFLVSP